MLRDKLWLNRRRAARCPNQNRAVKVATLSQSKNKMTAYKFPSGRPRVQMRRDPDPRKSQK